MYFVDKIKNNLYLKIILICFFPLSSYCLSNKAPQLRLKTGFSSTEVTAGDLIKNQKLQSMITFQPTVAWDLPTFSSRIGIHYLQELASPYGLTPISGIGISSYFYLYGLSTGYEFTLDDVVFQKSKPSAYLFASITPVNLNMNYFDTSSTIKNFYFNATMTDIGFGFGYDYPIFDNIILGAEFIFRNGIVYKSTTQGISYNGSTFFITLATAYY